MKLRLLVLITIGLIYSRCLHNQETTDRRPNIVFLLADDLGYNELGSYGQQIIQTPVLDRLAARSLRFTDFYAGNAVCAPSRAVLLTGKSSILSSIRGNAGFLGDDRWEGMALDKNEFTLGEMMKGAGYQTAFIGKWHLDYPDSVNTWACAHGFDYAVQEQWTARFGGRIFPPNRLWVNGDQEYIPYDYRQYDCKDHLRTDLALEYLDEIDREVPFFLFMSYRAPHNFEGPIRDTLLYADQEWPEIERVHAAKITLLDRQVGRLLQKLEEMGEIENTILMFTSDNGPHFASNGHQLEFFDSNGLLKGGKRDLFEGGIRVPLLVCWQDVVEGGSTSNHIAGFQDIMPTLAEIAGIEIPEQSDGLSFLPTLLDLNQEKHEALSFEFQLSGWFQTIPDGGFRQSVRMGEWKAVRYGIESSTEIYNLKDDIGELKDRSSDHHQLVLKAENLFESIRTEAPGFPYGGMVQHYKSQEKYIYKDNHFVKK